MLSSKKGPGAARRGPSPTLNLSLYRRREHSGDSWGTTTSRGSSVLSNQKFGCLAFSLHLECRWFHFLLGTHASAAL